MERREEVSVGPKEGGLTRCRTKRRETTDTFSGNEERSLKLFAGCSVLFLFAAAFLGGNPQDIPEGLGRIVISRDALITDYFVLAGCSPAFFNAALVLALCLGLVLALKTPFTGLTLAALFINAGYGLWGKNPLNILPILLGTFLYAKLHGGSPGRYLYTALFGTCLAPFVTEIPYLLPFPWAVNLLCAVGMGFAIGFVLPPLAMHTASMHMGYSLYNVGFAGGVLAFVLVCALRAFGLDSEPVLLWREGKDPWIAAGLFLFFAAAFFYGLHISGGKPGGLRSILRHTGRAVSDFVLMEGAGPVLMNMGLVGAFCTCYILIIGGDFSGPVVGSLLTAFGFAAFGAHLKNYPPILAGVILAAVLTGNSLALPGWQIAAVVAVGISPVAGQFGVLAGIIAGFLHAVIAMSTADLYGGLNLYNSGFSAGWVAIVMVPLAESFMKRFDRGGKSR